MLRLLLDPGSGAGMTLLGSWAGMTSLGHPRLRGVTRKRESSNIGFYEILILTQAWKIELGRAWP
jgi:hypothetical protein